MKIITRLLDFAKEIVLFILIISPIILIFLGVMYGIYLESKGVVHVEVEDSSKQVSMKCCINGKCVNYHFQCDEYFVFDDRAEFRIDKKRTNVIYFNGNCVIYSGKHNPAD